MKHQDWQRDSQQQRPKPSAFSRFMLIYALLVIAAFGLYLLSQYSGLNNLISQNTQGLINTATPTIALKSIDLQQTIEPQRIAQQPRQPVNTLHNQLPQRTAPTHPRGMVSAEYLAQYQADKANGNSAPARQSAASELTEEWIRKWDGNGQYLAQWQSINNRIDSSSVCSNHKRGSLDYRGCRKAAKVHFRDQCRAWELRSERDGEDFSKRMEQRYCSAANGFSPMG
jgi:hypothetical protein